MSSEIPISHELAECIQCLRSVLEQRVRMIDAVIAVLLQHPSVTELRHDGIPIPDPIAQTLPLMLQAIGSSSSTLIFLSKSPGLHTRDCYCVVRSVVELAVNICYIMAEGPDVAAQAERHARQKAFKDLQRESRIGDAVIRVTNEGCRDFSKVEGLEEDIAEFTSRNGREKAWVSKSIDDRIKSIGENLGDSASNKLHFSRFMIYRHSSEVLHGTLFSTLHFLGMTMPSGRPHTLAETAESIGQQHMLILFAAGFALSAIVDAFHSAYGFQMLYEESNLLTQSLGEIPYYKNQHNPSKSSQE